MLTGCPSQEGEPQQRDAGYAKGLGRPTGAGESPVADAAAWGCWSVFLSTTGHEKPCGKLGGPPSKARILLATDSEPVP